QVRQRNLRLTPDDARAARRRIDLHVLDARLGRERSLDASNTPGAANAVDEEQRLAPAAAQVANRVTRDLRARPDAMRIVGAAGTFALIRFAAHRFAAHPVAVHPAAAHPADALFRSHRASS